MPINPSIVISGLSMRASSAYVISLKLCGGIFVAIPTAIPLAPLTNRAGILVGNTSGSTSLLS